VIRYLVIQAIAQEPKVIEPFDDDAHQFPFALDIIQKKQQKLMFFGCTLRLQENPKPLQIALARKRLMSLLPLPVNV
jgi:hypothetical protein